MSRVRLSVGYDDALGNFANATGVAALVLEEYRDTNYKMYFFKHNADEYIYLATQFPHRRRTSAALADIHLHYIPMVNPASAKVVYLSLEYAWAGIGEEMPADAGWSKSNPTITINTTDAYKHLLADLATNIAAPAGDTYSSILLLRLGRLGTSLNDTYDDNKGDHTSQANLGLLYVDLHFLCDRFGSIQRAAS